MECFVPARGHATSEELERLSDATKRPQLRKQLLLAKPKLPLVPALRSRLDPHDDAVVHAATALANLSVATELFRPHLILDSELLHRLIALIAAPAAPCAARAAAARLLKNVALDDEVRLAVARAGAVRALVDACSADASIGLQEQAARALGNLAAFQGLAECVFEAGGVDALLRLYSAGEPTARDGALLALANLSSSARTRATLMRARIVPLLRTQIADTNPDSTPRANAGWILASLAVDPAQAAEVVALGGVELLTAYARIDCTKSKEEAAWALATLSSAEEHAVAMQGLGAVTPLLELVSTPDHGVRLQALWALANLSVHEANKESMGAAGALEALLSILLELGDDELATQAARAVANLLVHASNRVIFIHRPSMATWRERLYRGAHSSSNQLAEAAARALANLSFDADAASTLLEAGAASLVLELIKSSSTGVRQEAGWLAVNLSLACRPLDADKPTVAAHEPPPPLAPRRQTCELEQLIVPFVDYLNSPQLGLQEQLLWALANLSRCESFRMRILALGAVGAACQLRRSSSPKICAAANQLLTSLGVALTPNSRRALSRTEESKALRFKGGSVPRKSSRLSMTSQYAMVAEAMAGG